MTLEKMCKMCGKNKPLGEFPTFAWAPARMIGRGSNFCKKCFDKVNPSEKKTKSDKGAA